MMTWTQFRAFDADPAVVLHINRQYDTQTTSKGGKLTAHEIGWNIRARQAGKDDVYGIVHIHWKPKDGHSQVNHNISAHFKETHASQRTSGKSNQNEISHPDDHIFYNRFVILKAVYTAHKSADRTRPEGAKTGWTSLSKTWITKDMVDEFRALNDQASLTQLGKNNLYNLANWDKDGWNSYQEWMNKT